MSDPVTNVEIEDVLSSIRRLVSEEAKPRKAPDIRTPERLVLSPALRVADPEEAQDSASPDAVIDDDAMETDAAVSGGIDPGQPAVPEPPIVLTETALDADPKEADFGDAAERTQSDAVRPASLVLEPVTRVDPVTEASEEPADADFGSDATLADKDDAILLTGDAAGDDRLPEDPVAEESAEADQLAALRASLTDILIPAEEEPDSPEPMADDDQAWSEDGEPETADAIESIQSREDSLERKIAMLEGMLKRQATGWTPEPDAEADAVRDTFEAFEAERNAPDQLDDALTESDQVDTSDETDQLTAKPEPEEADVGQSVPKDEDETVAAPEADFVAPGVEASVDRATTDEGGPDAPDHGDPVTDTVDADAAKAAFLRHTSQSLDWEDHVPEQSAEPASTTADPAPVAEAETGSVPAELDEEALQALVAQIVRQELQGVLGERITRNVRKLVRREIHRVLMSKDFD